MENEETLKAIVKLATSNWKAGHLAGEKELFLLWHKNLLSGFMS